MLDTAEQTKLHMFSFKEAALRLYEHYINKITFDNTVPVEGTFVMAGGLFTSLYNNERPNDIDIFLFSKDRGALGRVLSRHKASGFKLFNPKISTVIYTGKKIHTILEKEISDLKYQIMVMSPEISPEDLIKTFDYVHSCIFYTPHDNKIQTFPRVLEVIERKILMENPLRDGDLIWSAQRRQKFLDRGWRDVRINTMYDEPKELGLSAP